MKTIKTCLLTLAAFTTIAFAKAQTADEIIAKHIEAIGGKEKLSQVTSIYMESATEVMGNEMNTKTTILNGKGFKNESDFNGQNIVQVATDKGGWAINPFTGSSDPTPMSNEEFKGSKDQIYFGPLVNYAEHGAKVELMGREEIGDVNAYKLKYTNKDSAETIYYIDPATSYIIQAVRKGNAMGQEVTVTIRFSNYKKTDFGIVIPNTTNVDMEQFALKTTVKKVEINKPVDPSIFEMPGK